MEVSLKEKELKKRGYRDVEDCKNYLALKAVEKHLDTYDNGESELAGIIIDMKKQFDNVLIINKYNGDWKKISSHAGLTENFMRDFHKELNWACISMYQMLSEDFIEEMREYTSVYFYKIVEYQVLSINTIRTFQSELGENDNELWEHLSEYQEFSEEILREFKNKVYWPAVTNLNLSENFIREFRDYIDWEQMSLKRDLSHEFILEFKHRFNWEYMLDFHKFSEDILRQCCEYFTLDDWEIVSYSQCLSEAFIREYQNKVGWCWIYRYQDISYEFKVEFKKYIHELGFVFSDN